MSPCVAHVRDSEPSILCRRVTRCPGSVGKITLTQERGALHVVQDAISSTSLRAEHGHVIVPPKRIGLDGPAAHDLLEEGRVSGSCRWSSGDWMRPRAWSAASILWSQCVGLRVTLERFPLRHLARGYQVVD